MAKQKVKPPEEKTACAPQCPVCNSTDCGHQAPATKFLPKGLKVDWE